MPLDRSKLHKGFQTYLANAETASGMTYEDFAKVLGKSGLEKHAELRSLLIKKTASATATPTLSSQSGCR